MSNVEPKITCRYKNVVVNCLSFIVKKRPHLWMA